MSEKIIVGPINKGLRSDREPFVIDNDSFPILQNAYQWRGRIKRKRGTELLGRLTRYFNSNDVQYNSGSATITLDASGIGNLLTGFSLEVGSIVPGSVVITDTISLVVYTDLAMDGTLSPSGTIDYSTGDITILVAATDAISATFLYLPMLPVMGLETLVLDSSAYPGTLAYDTKYAYNILRVAPYAIYDVSFYKNPDTATYPGYVKKTNYTPFTWNGQNYQQFWTTNHQGAHWATNGIKIPFDSTKVGMQFKNITGVVINAAGPPALATLTIVAHGLVRGDFVFINEVIGITGINFQTGYVVSADPQAANTVQVEFPNATLGGAYISGGIAQYLTNRSNTTIDCMRWYDGDPTNGSPSAPALTERKGWVNFCPPLSRSNFSIANLPAAQYYLVTARLVLPFKDRLLFFGPVVQTSGGTPIYLADTVVYSQNGTAYYTSSFTGDPSLPTTQFTPILVPDNQTATASAYWGDQTGFGGWISAGVAKPIVTVSQNEDVLIVGFSNIQTKLVYSGNDIVPFNFFLINSEYGSTGTFSSITTDDGVMSRGNRGLVITSQTNCQRIDLEIPDVIFQSRLVDNGAERFTAQRDFINEWIYFTYTPNTDNTVDEASYNIFPSITLLYNYRDQSWAQFLESYTTYGSFTKQTGFTWATVGTQFKKWSAWNQPWNAGQSTVLQPLVIAGNQQGYVMIRTGGTAEAPSLFISGITAGKLTVQNHGLNNGDFILITGCLGTIAPMVNNQIFSVMNQTTNTFDLNPVIDQGALVYGGLGQITRLYVPFIQTKQFQTAWSMSRKTRLGYQQYLLSTTDISEIQLLIFLSQDNETEWSNSPIVPDTNSENNSLIYSTVLYTCPESTNLGLTPANINLQMVTATNQAQIWHRVNTSLLGDTVQLGFTMSDEQMRKFHIKGPDFAITGISRTTQCVLTCTGLFPTGSIIQINGVVGMPQLNGNNYYVITSSPTTVTIFLDSSGFPTPYESGGVANLVSPLNQTAEIELHGMVLDVSPSMVLA